MLLLLSYLYSCYADVFLMLVKYILILIHMHIFLLHNFLSQLPIMEYLEETRPEKPLLPKDARERTLVSA